MAAPDEDRGRRLGPADRERLRQDRALFERFADRRHPVERELLVERFLPLARSLAARYMRHGEPFEDVYQVACLGLVKAIDGFDVTRDRAFSSYAVPTIVGEIKRYYRDRTWTVHVPRDLQDLALVVRRAADEFEREHHRAPGVAEISKSLEISGEDVLEALQASRARRADSLDAAVGDGNDETTGSDHIGVDEPGFARVEDRALLRRLMRALSRRAKLVVRLYYEQDLTQQQIGRRIGLSQMQVSRVLRRSLARLQTYGEHAHGTDRTIVAS